MNKKDKTINEIVRRLKSRNLIFFVGAGISKDAPANLPLASELRKGIIKTLCNNSEYLADECSYILEITGNLRPEIMFQMMYNESGDKALNVLEIFNEGKPNLFHLFLSRTAKAGYINAVLTTNFDSLIENAMKQNEIKVTQYASGEEFKNWSIKAKERNIECDIFKFHGTLKNVYGDNKRKTIQMALSQVTHPYTQAKREVLEYFLKNYDIVFLGYSGLDMFDAYPILFSTKSAREIFWIEHSRDEKKFEVEDFEKIKMKSKHDHIDKLILMRGESARIICHAGKFIGAIWNKLKFGDISVSEGVQLDYLTYFDRWAKDKQVSKYTFLMTANMVGYFTGGLTKAIEYYKKGLDESKKARDKHIIARILNCLGTSYDNYGYPDKAIEYHKKSLVILDEIGEIKYKAVSLGDLGVTYGKKTEYAEALQCYEESLKISEEVGDMSIKGWVLGNMGVIYHKNKEYAKAIECYEKSLEIIEEKGDVIFTVKTLDNLGLAYTYIGNMDKAIECYDKAIDIGEKLGGAFGPFGKERMEGKLFALINTLEISKDNNKN